MRFLQGSGKRENMQNEFSAKLKLRMLGALVTVALLATIVPLRLAAQDDDDPPTRAARLGHVDGSVSFQPAGESEWEPAAPNRPMTTGDKLWADHDSRAGVQLGSTSIHINSNTGISFLNLDDRTVQIQLSSGSMSVRVRRLERDDVFEIDTPNQAFSILQPGQYRIEASEDGSRTIVTVRDGEGESTGNGQTYTVHAGQRATFSGTDRLNADVEQVGDPDDFDRWSDGRNRRFDDSRSARYVSPDVVGSQDLDEYGDWQPSAEYGNVWYPRVEPGWAPYHAGHWAWIDPWGWTWVDDAPWGYAPFHYGRWASVGGRWGWIPGPREVRPVYAPALVVFVGGGGPGMGGNVAWFALGPREVYVPPYHVSPAYVNRVNISNTTVNQTTVTNVYNTTIVNNNTTVNNVTYVNRNVNGAVTAVPQHAFAGGQPVARVAVPMTRQQIAAAPVNARVAVAPSQTAVMGPRAGTANPVAAPPRAMFTRPVIAKAAPPPAPVSFAAKQQVLAAHPGQPVARQEMQRLRPANAPASQPVVKQAPPGKPATPASTPNMARPGNQPANRMTNSPANQPAYRPVNPNANDRPVATPPNRPQPNQPPSNQPPVNQPPNRPTQPNRPFEPPARNDRQPAAQPNNPPAANPSAPNRPAPPPVRNDRPVAQPPANRPVQPSQPPQNTRPADTPRRDEAPPRPQTAPPSNRPPQSTPPAEARPQMQPHPQPQPPPKPQTPQDKKRQEDQKKQDQKLH